MKNKFSSLRKVLSLFAAANMFYFSSCNKQEIIAEETKQDQMDIRLKEMSSQSNLLSSFKLYFIDAIPGHRKIGQFDCNPGGLCFLDNIIPFPQLVLFPQLKIPDCSLVDCNNPWNFRNIFVGPIPRYKDYFKGDPDPEPNIGFVPFRITSHIAVLQFYAEVKGTLNSQALTLPASFAWPKEVSKSLRLVGYTIPAGTYPVVFDTRSKTFNAIVSVK